MSICNSGSLGDRALPSCRCLCACLFVTGQFVSFFPLHPLRRFHSPPDFPSSKPNPQLQVPSPQFPAPSSQSPVPVYGLACHGIASDLPRPAACLTSLCSASPRLTSPHLTSPRLTSLFLASPRHAPSLLPSPSHTSPLHLAFVSSLPPVLCIDCPASACFSRCGPGAAGPIGVVFGVSVAWLAAEG